MFDTKPIPLYEAFLFLQSRLADCTSEEYYSRTRFRFLESKAAYDLCFDLLKRLDSKLLSAITVDDATLRLLFSPLCTKGSRDAGDLGDSIADILVPTVCDFALCGTDEFFIRLRKNVANVPQNVAMAILPDDASFDIDGSAEIYRVINECSWSQASKLTLLDLVVNPGKYIEMLEKTLVPIADEFMRNECIWSELICLYKETYAPYPTLSDALSNVFGYVINPKVDLYTAYPSVTGYRRAFFYEYTEEKPVKFVAVIGVMYGLFKKLSTVEPSTESELSRIMSVLGDPRRFCIVSRLMEKPMYGREIAKLLGLTPGSVSHHLSILMGAELVTYSVDGNKINYHLNLERMHDFLKTMEVKFGSNAVADKESTLAGKPPVSSVDEISK